MCCLSGEHPNFLNATRVSSFGKNKSQFVLCTNDGNSVGVPVDDECRIRPGVGEPSLRACRERRGWGRPVGLVLKRRGLASEELTERLRVLGRQVPLHATAQALLEVGGVSTGSGGCAVQRGRCRAEVPQASVTSDCGSCRSWCWECGLEWYLPRFSELPSRGRRLGFHPRAMLQPRACVALKWNQRRTIRA